MKYLILATAGFVWLQSASATPVCVSGTLASYEALGSGGCTIGADTVASFATLTGITGATVIGTSAVTITPSGSTAAPQLSFSVSQTASAPVLKEAIFTYTISGPAFTSTMILLSGSSETGDGAVTDTQNYCAGGQFGANGVTGCTGTATGALVALDGIQQNDQAALSKPLLLSITDDFTIDGGTAGTASGGTFVDQFTATSATPEPATYLLTSAGLLFATLRKFRWTNRKS